MTDVLMTPTAERDLVAAYETRDDAKIVQAALRAIGIPGSHISIGDPADVVASLRGEMHDEMTNAFVVPNAGFIGTKESVKGTLIVSFLATLAGVLISFPLAAIDFVIPTAHSCWCSR